MKIGQYDSRLCHAAHWAIIYTDAGPLCLPLLHSFECCTFSWGNFSKKKYFTREHSNRSEIWGGIFNDHFIAN